MKLADMKSIKNMDKDDLLGVLGLQTKDSFTGQLLGTLGTFGIGMLVGAGVALLLAPKPGRELREQIRSKLRRSSEHDLLDGESDAQGAAGASANPA
jgi:YtxH-like protein